MTGMYFISFRILGFPRRKDNISIQEGIAQDCSKKWEGQRRKGKKKKKKYPMTTSYRNQNYYIPLGLSGLEQTASSLSFSLALVRGVHTRASVERRSREFRETWAAAREEKRRVSLFSCLSCLAPSVNLRGHLRVSRVLLDGPRKKRDCSQSRSRTAS